MDRAPAATYRVQLGPSSTFSHLQALTSYLNALGVSDLYTSPILTAGRGGTHGYDISNHNELNPELGTQEDLRALAGQLHAHNMGLVVDFVPNHMGIDPQTNEWWRDVLENGPSSPYARFFDIDWLPVKAELRDKVLLPILGDQYGRVLERGELQLELVDGALILHYFDRQLPINPRQAPLVFGYGLESLTRALGDDHPDVLELKGILTALSSLPAMSETVESAIVERQQAKEAARERLARLAHRSEAIARHIDEAVRVFNGCPGDASSFDLLHGLLEVQAYRLAYWRTAFDEINYRRFFDVNDLAGLRMEDPRVFAATHALLLDLVVERSVTGIRIDHPDGLFDPAAYFQSLRAAINERLPAGAGVYVVAEKILARGERLRDNWEVHGTTGYNVLNTINGLFVHAEGLADLRRAYRRFSAYRHSAADTAYSAKRLMMRSAMASELNVLARALNRLSETDRTSRDFTLTNLRRVLVEVIACFPVYRTYVTEQGAGNEDIAVVDAAVDNARRRNPIEERSIFEFVRQVLLPSAAGQPASSERLRDRSVAFAQKFQQYTAPVVAKGLEDTAFYNDVLLLSANEVGGDLQHRARSVAELHQDNLHRLTRWPLEMTAASTHDTKRGEDARARINVISELAGEWAAEVRKWSVTNDASRTSLGDLAAPDRNDEWMFYQALVGAWPAESLSSPVPRVAPADFVRRMKDYMRKALKEAKRHTSWLHENLEYERAVEAFIDEVLTGRTAEPFLAAFIPLQRRIAWFGMLNSLSQLVLRLGAPGVPDIYQGSELWNLALVDPDNRQPVDFERRRQLLAELEPLAGAIAARVACHDRPEHGGHNEILMALRQLFDDWPDGRIKLLTMTTALRLRRANPDLFLFGEYEGLGGDVDDPHLIAFSRRHNEEEILVVVPRFAATLLKGVPRAPFGMERWRTASVRLPRRLAHARFVNAFTGEAVEPVVHRGVPWLLAGSVFQSWPVAMLRVGRL